jgi:serine/threonine protein kinase
MKGTFTENKVIDLLIQILKGMFQLIEKGIVHKNLVPENILFSQNVLKLSDFGSLKIRNEILRNPEKQIRSEYKSP